ncbi:MAG: ABC transporter permease subunit, partial [Chloroflexota bacterium]|nr:ABC transporter permease subunit [Chloroflexota bacterium]
ASARRLLPSVVVTLWVVLVLLPVVPLVIWSGAFAWRWPDLLPSAWSGRAWRYVFSPTTQVRPGLTGSITVALLTMFAALAIGAPAGIAIGRMTFRGKRAIEMLLLAPFIVPGLVVTMGIQIVFIHLRLTDTVQGVVLAHLMPALPYVIVSVAGVAANLGVQVEEQARSLGATPWQAFFHITLPLLRPGLAVGGLFAFLVSWSQYTSTLIIGGGKVQTLPLLVYTFTRSGDNPIAAALALLFVAPAVLALALASRTLRQRQAVVGGRV